MCRFETDSSTLNSDVDIAGSLIPHLLEILGGLDRGYGVAETRE